MVGTKSPKEILQEANTELGLALDDTEIDYLAEAYGVWHGLAINHPGSIELLVSAMLRVDLSEHEKLDISSRRQTRSSAWPLMIQR
jgi:phosphoribosylformylglycinamidine synthase